LGAACKRVAICQVKHVALSYGVAACSLLCPVLSERVVLHAVCAICVPMTGTDCACVALV
jgi:hypothetical protein